MQVFAPKFLNAIKIQRISEKLQISEIFLFFLFRQKRPHITKKYLSLPHGSEKEPDTQRKTQRQMAKFLYGASVQGIQSFIFKTNTLKEIIGASELVEEICTSMFAELIGKDTCKLGNDPNAIINAAGNIKYIFDDEQKCRQVFRDFPRTILMRAPGITISQAVVKIEGGRELSEEIKLLEDKLRAKRNQPMQPMDTGLMCMARSKETWLPERWHADGKIADESTWQKIRAIDRDRLWEKATGTKNIDFLQQEITEDTKLFTGDNDWIAIIHADGNGLGKIVRAIGGNSRGGNSSEDFHSFSTLLDKSTCEAARHAFEVILKKYYEDDSKHIPFRPIVLGGDDLTVIIRGDLAIDFTNDYLDAFEKKTRENFSTLADRYEELEDGLTACAGIAFIKSSFPYYYGYNLAEELCGEAKKASGREHSCLMFHKVQDSYVSSYEDIVKRELTTPEGHSFKFGPYFIHSDANNEFWDIGELTDILKKLSGLNGNAVKSTIRKWLSAMMLHNGSAKAEQLLRRLKDINPDKETIKQLTEGRVIKDGPTKGLKSYPAYDALSLHSIYYQKTK